VPLYDIENTLSTGKSFGELGIIYKQKRMAHIICKTDCLIATIAADRYMRFIA
jgi:CRP-like cAMP-binding protein